MPEIDYEEIYQELAARLEFMENLDRNEAEKRAALYLRQLRTNKTAS